jgi:carotenoid cleavage dioxygenase-like enzyme
MQSLRGLVVVGAVSAGGLGWPGWFESETTEIVDPVQLVVASGALPSWLKGSLLRTGSGLYENGKRRFGHVFDGHAKLSKLQFNESGVFFQTRFVQTDVYKKSEKLHDIAPHLTFYPVIPPWKLNPEVLVGPTDAANINVWQTGNVVYAGCEQLTTTSFDPETLTTIGHTKYSAVGLAVTGMAPSMSGAHPSRFPNTTDSVGWSGDFKMAGAKQTIKLHRDRDTPTGLTRQTIGQVQADWMPMMHSFAVTSKYAMLPQYPMKVEIGKAMEHMDVLDGTIWFGDDQQPTLLHVFDLHANPARGDTPPPPVKSFEVPAFMAVHQISAFDAISADGRPLLVFDCIAYPDGAFMTNRQSFGNLTCMQDPVCTKAYIAKGAYTRYTLDMSAEDATEDSAGGSGDGGVEHASYSEDAYSKNFTVHSREVIDPTHGPMAVEMPRMNDQFEASPRYCIFYSGASYPITDFDMNPMLLKCNVCSAPPAGGNASAIADVLSWSRQNHYPSEAIFVPRPGGTAEDDGVLLSIVLSGEMQRSYLIVLDAKDMSELAMAYLPVRVPYDVHGHFVQQG